MLARNTPPEVVDLKRLLPALVLLTLAPTAACAQPASFDHNPRLEARLGVTGLFEDDLDATYGVFPAGELGVSWRISPTTRFGLALCYSARDGDPYYDTPGFPSTGSDARGCAWSR